MNSIRDSVGSIASPNSPTQTQHGRTLERIASDVRVSRGSDGLGTVTKTSIRGLDEPQRASRLAELSAEVQRPESPAEAEQLAAGAADLIATRERADLAAISPVATARTMSLLG